MTAKPEEASRGYFRLLNQLRGVAALLVVWAHLVGQWLPARGLAWGPAAQVERFVSGPLNITQDFGFLGVAIFFLISGFVVTRSATRETTRTFLVRRILRIYPPLVVAIVVSLGAAVVTRETGRNGGVDPSVLETLSPAVLLKSVTMLGYYTVPQVVVVGVAWTLAIEVIFYALITVSGPILRARRLPDGAATLAMIAVIAVVVAFNRSLGDGFFLLSVSCSYVPLLLLGHVLYLVTQRSLHPLAGVGLVGLLWILFVWAVERTQPVFLTAGDSYGSSITVAVLLVVAAVLLEPHARPSRALDAVAARSYSLYLVHGPIGLLVLDGLWTAGVAYRWALLVALVAIAVGVELTYRGVERPSIRLARRLTRGRAPAVPAQVVGAENEAMPRDDDGSPTAQPEAVADGGPAPVLPAAAAPPA